MKAMVLHPFQALDNKGHLYFFRKGDMVSFNLRDLSFENGAKAEFKIKGTDNLVTIYFEDVEITEAETLEDTVFLQKFENGIKDRNKIVFLSSSAQNFNRRFVFSFGELEHPESKHRNMESLLFSIAFSMAKDRRIETPLIRHFSCYSKVTTDEEGRKTVVFTDYCQLIDVEDNHETVMDSEYCDLKTMLKHVFEGG